MALRPQFIQSWVPETTLPPSFPGQANFWLISFKFNQPFTWRLQTHRRARQLRWVSCLTLAGRVTLADRTTVLHINSTRLSLSFESPIALVLTPVTSLLLCGWIVPRTGKFTRSIKGSSRAHQGYSAVNRCYRLQPLMTALSSLARLTGTTLSVMSVT